MNVQEVLKRFAALAGMSGAEAAPWVPLCTQAAREIKSKTRAGVDVADDRLYPPAAALAFYRYTLCRSSEPGVESFTAGDVTINGDRQKSVEMARILLQEARASAADVLADDGFVFCGVKA